MSLTMARPSFRRCVEMADAVAAVAGVSTSGRAEAPVHAGSGLRGTARGEGRPLPGWTREAGHRVPRVARRQKRDEASAATNPSFLNEITVSSSLTKEDDTCFRLRRLNVYYSL